MTSFLEKRNPIQISLALHFLFLGFCALLVWSSSWKWQKRNIEIEVFEFPKAANPSLNLQPQKVKIKEVPKEQPRAVYGLSRKAITASDSVTDAAEIKQGNTVAKEADNLKLNANDADSLPIPADDYMVSQMPRLKSEVRIPYPPEAKKASVEGPVVMDLLIDANGKVRKVDLIKGPGYGLNEAAVAALEKFEFSPARVGDQSVAVKIRYTYRFVLENR